MMKSVQHTCLYLSLLLLVAHSLVPHRHEAEREPAVIGARAATLPGLLDWLTAVFQQDLGEDHLNNYRPSYEYSLVFSLPDLSSLFRLHRQDFLLQSLAYLPPPASGYQCLRLPLIISRGPPHSPASIA